MNPSIKIVKSPEEIKITSRLADKIWREHYIPIIGKEQVDYMVGKYQSEKAIFDQINSCNYFYFLINYSDRPVGYIGFQIFENVLYLSKYYIQSENRGKGLGRYSMDFIKDFAKSQNVKSIYLTVNKNNSDSINAYLKMGFRNEGPIVTDIGNGFIMDDYKMTFVLDS